MPTGLFRGGVGRRGKVPASARPARRDRRFLRAVRPGPGGAAGPGGGSGAEAPAKPAGSDEEVRYIRLESP